MNYVLSDGAVISGDAQFVALFAKADKELREKTAQWVQTLREQGIAAAHPDDGWVDQEKNTVQFVYPHFRDTVAVGSKVALGWHDKFRIVSVAGLSKTFFGSEIISFVAEKGWGDGD